MPRLCPSYAPFPHLPHLTFYPGPNHPWHAPYLLCLFPMRLNSEVRGLAYFSFSVHKHGMINTYLFTERMDRCPRREGESSIPSLIWPGTSLVSAWVDLEKKSHTWGMRSICLWYGYRWLGPRGSLLALSPRAVMFKVHNHVAFRGDKTVEEKFHSGSGNCY